MSPILVLLSIFFVFTLIFGALVMAFLSVGPMGKEPVRVRARRPRNELWDGPEGDEYD